MDIVFDLFRNINCSKAYQEQIVNELKSFHSTWDIEKEENTLNDHQESNTDILEQERGCVDLAPKENEEELAEIDKIISKAQSIIAKYDSSKNKQTKTTLISSSINVNKTTTAALKRNTSNNDELLAKTSNVTSAMSKNHENKGMIKAKLVQSSSSSLLNNNNLRKKPVYMNAPYKTESVNTFKRSKSSLTVRSSSISSLNQNHVVAPRTQRESLASEEDLINATSNSNKYVNDLQKFSKPEIKQIATNPIVEKLEKINLNEETKMRHFPFTSSIKFKEIAPTLSLPYRLSNLANSNLKLYISIENESAKRSNVSLNKQENTFITKLKQSFANHQPNSLNLVENFQLSCTNLAYKKGMNVVDKQLYYLENNQYNIKKMTKAEQFLALFKLKILIKNSEKFNTNLNQQMNLNLPSNSKSKRKAQVEETSEYLKRYESIKPNMRQIGRASCRERV